MRLVPESDVLLVQESCLSTSSVVLLLLLLLLILFVVVVRRDEVFCELDFSRFPTTFWRLAFSPGFLLLSGDIGFGGERPPPPSRTPFLGPRGGSGGERPPRAGPPGISLPLCICVYIYIYICICVCTSPPPDEVLFFSFVFIL